MPSVVRLAIAALVWLAVASCTTPADSLPAASQPPLIHVTWREGLPWSAQLALEQRYALDNLGPMQGTTWVYTLRNVSAGNILALVNEPAVADTHHLDRINFSVAADAMPFVPPWDDELTVGEPMPVNPAPVSTTADPEQFLTIRTSADAEALRRRLNSFLWGRPALPVALPASVIEGVPDHRFTDMAGLARIDALSIDLDFGFSSYAYHFLPTAPNGEVIVYHEGHGDDFARSKRQIAAFIAEGYAVVALNMPLAGRAPHPQITEQATGDPISIDTHDQFGLLAPERGHPVRYFVEPTVIAINHLVQRHRYQRISAVGISGGGWTTVLAAAVDTRISASFPVAGALPRYLQTTLARDEGDWEQTLPELYAVANYLDLFVLGAAGRGRQQVQIFNAFDPCCFAGERWRSYAGALKARVAGLAGGSLDIWSDSTHREHTLSGASVRRILEALDH